MLLTKVVVDSYRTITTPQSIEIDPKTTVLIGANESGKTNLLQAIECLMLNKNIQPEDISKCRRRKYQKTELPIINYTFSLSKEDQERMAKLDLTFEDVKCIEIRKKGNAIDNYSFVIPKGCYMDQRVKEKENSLTKAITVLKKEKRSTDSKLNKLTSNLKRLRNKIVHQGMTLSQIKDIEKEMAFLDSKINNLENEKSRINDQIYTAKKDLETIQENLKKSKEKVLDSSADIKTKIINALPKIVYISNPELISEIVPISEIIQQKTPRSVTVGNLLKIGELEDLTILNQDPRRVKTILRDVSSIISEKLSEIWKQEQIQVELTKEGGSLIITINEKVAVSSPPQERSEGFQWFLSFFANFFSDPINHSNRRIILLDEPALRLHPRGQKDFLKMLEKISKKNQVIYTSHSPFLINRNYPHRIRVLKKDPKKGTLINNKPYSDGKTRFWEPLKTAIGVCLGDLFSLDENNLIVEGISDQIIIMGVSNKLAIIDAPFLDLEKITIVPAMGAPSVAYLAKFAVAEGLGAIALLDNDSEGKKVFKQIKDEQGITVKNVDQLKKGAHTIEDLIPRDQYIEAVNSFYKRIELPDFKEYSKPKEDKTKIKGIIPEIDIYFDKMGYSFDKVSVAKELIHRLDIRKENISEFESFVTLFELIDKMV